MNSIIKKILTLSIFYFTTLYAQDLSTCYSVQFASSKNPISLNKYPKNSKLMHIGGYYTIRMGCFEKMKHVKPLYQNLKQKFHNIEIVSTYKFRFKNKKHNIYEPQKSLKSLNENLTVCRGINCNNKKNDPLKKVSLKKASTLIRNSKIAILSIPKTIHRSKEENRTISSSNFIRFYIDPYVRLCIGQKPTNATRDHNYDLLLRLGLQYTHIFNQYWHFYTDDRIIPYYQNKNNNISKGLKIDIKELYLMSNDIFLNRLNFLIGRKVLKDYRSWYYNTSLDTIGIFNKHDLLLYKLYLGTKLSSDTIIDTENQNSNDLKNLKFLIGNLSYQYYIKNFAQIFGIYEKKGIREIKWFGLRFRGKFPAYNDRYQYWLDLAYANGKENNSFNKVKGLGADVGMKYDFNNTKNSIAFSLAYGSGGKNYYIQPLMSNNNSDFLSKHLSFRYYGEFFEPQLTNIFISSFYFIHNLRKYRKFVVALHNYRQVKASSFEYKATGCTVFPNGINKDLGNEIDFIYGKYFQREYYWRFSLGYFLGGSAFNNVTDKKDGLNARFNFRYYW